MGGKKERDGETRSGGAPGKGREEKEGGAENGGEGGQEKGVKGEPEATVCIRKSLYKRYHLRRNQQKELKKAVENRKF